MSLSTDASVRRPAAPELTAMFFPFSRPNAPRSRPRAAVIHADGPQVAAQSRPGGRRTGDSLGRGRIMALRFVVRLMAMSPERRAGIVAPGPAPVAEPGHTYVRGVEVVGAAVAANNARLAGVLLAVDRLIDDAVPDGPLATAAKHAARAVAVHAEAGPHEHWRAVYAPFEPTIPFQLLLLE